MQPAASSVLVFYQSAGLSFAGQNVLCGGVCQDIPGVDMVFN